MLRAFIHRLGYIKRQAALTVIVIALHIAAAISIATFGEIYYFGALAQVAAAIVVAYWLACDAFTECVLAFREHTFVRRMCLRWSRYAHSCVSHIRNQNPSIWEAYLCFNALTVLSTCFVLYCDR